MKSKRMLASLLVLLMLLSLFPGMSLANSDAELSLSTDAYLVTKGDSVQITTGFDTAVESNTAMLYYSFDKELFAYNDFQVGSGVSIVDISETDDGVLVTVMTPNYAAKSYGKLVLKARNSAPLTNGWATVSVEVQYVVRDADGEKVIETATASTAFTTRGDGSTGVDDDIIDDDERNRLLGDTNGDDVIDLIDLSNMIDWYGYTTQTEGWNTRYVFFDFNNNGSIDISDVVFVAKLITFTKTETEEEKAERAILLYQQYQEALVAGNTAAALDYLLQSATLGYATAQVTLGTAYAAGNLGLDVDIYQTINWYQRALDQGNTSMSSSANTYAGRYFNGTNGVTKDNTVAGYLYKIAAQAGNNKAGRYVGLTYELGLGDFEVDYAEAAYWYGVAGSDVTSMYYLGRLYEFGQGVEQDYDKAYQLFYAAANGSASQDSVLGTGKIGLASLYENGRGVTLDTDAAMALYNKAKSDGYQTIVDGEPVSVTAIREVMGFYTGSSYATGTAVTAVALEYDYSIQNRALTLDSFSVSGRTITKIYTNDEPATTDTPVNGGNYVILELETTGTSSSVTVTQERSLLAYPVRLLGDGPDNDAVLLSDGNAYQNTAAINLIVDDFEQYEYYDSEIAENPLPYNLYLPESYDGSKTYPLVLFIPDAGSNSDTVTDAITKYVGATIWASPEEQAKHECIVLVPQFTTTLANEIGRPCEDDFLWRPGIAYYVSLLEYIIDEYAVDESRIYQTGQSQGCMAGIAIANKYPNLFAAQFLVAGQWNAEEMAAIKDNNLFISVCTGDSKAYPGMQASVAVWEAAGVTVAKSEENWDMLSSAEEFDALVADMLAQGCNINFSVLQGGGHTQTWCVAYYIEAIRDWMFVQTL